MTLLSYSILKTLSYRDLFDYPLTTEEIWQFLIEEKASKAAVAKALAEMAAEKVIGEKSGFYFLPGREEIVPLRQRREKFSQGKLRKLDRAVRFLRLVPWVKAVFATGAVAVGNADEGADLDILIITSPKRVWLSRLFSYFILIALGVKRRAGSKVGRDKVCPNMFFAADHLALPSDEQNLYTAHEVVQAKPLWERGPVYRQFLDENTWIEKFLPNAKESQDIKIYRSAGYKETKSSSSPLISLYLYISVSFLDIVERFVYKSQLRYMAGKRTIEVVTPHRILFHAADLPARVLDAYTKKLDKTHNRPL